MTKAEVERQLQAERAILGQGMDERWHWRDLAETVGRIAVLETIRQEAIKEAVQ